MPFPRLLSALGVSALLGAPAFAQTAQPANADLIKRGEYLTTAGDCIACHTVQGGKPFAGGLLMNTPFGTIKTPNITADRETGIGSWSDDDFYKAMHEGISKDQGYLYPVFPFPWYTNVTRDDVLAIKAYLFSLPPEKGNKVEVNFRFPFNVRTSLFAWRTAFFKAHEFAADPKKSEEENRGAYLVEGLGHCGECHNASKLTGVTNLSGKLQGGKIENWYAPNITADGRDGVGRWSNDEIVQYLKTGFAPKMGLVLGPMQQTIEDSLSKMEDKDLHAIASYLKSTPGKQDITPPPSKSASAEISRGAIAYLTHCAYCHQQDGKGVVGQIPALAGNGAVASQGPQNVLSVVVGGLYAQQGYAPMPAVGQGMTDQEIADVTDYVRNSWGNVGGKEAMGNVNAIRSQVRTQMAMNLPNGCDDIHVPEIKAALDTPGARDVLARVNPTDGNPTASLQAPIAQLLDMVAKNAPKASLEDVVNDMTRAYCPTLRANTSLDQPARAEAIGNFAMLAYGEASKRGVSKK